MKCLALALRGPLEKKHKIIKGVPIGTPFLWNSNFIPILFHLAAVTKYCRYLCSELFNSNMDNKNLIEELARRIQYAATQPKYVGSEEACQMLLCSASTLRKLDRAGKTNPMKVGRRKIYLREAIEKLIMDS